MASWLDNAIIYQILVDRFAGTDEQYDPHKTLWAGGTLQATTEKVPYLERLGVNALLISPVNSCLSYHGYDIVDFRNIDERFGGEAGLRKLISACHSRNIKVIIDLVANHCSNQHPFFLDAVSNPESIYRDWFIFTNWPNPYHNFFGYKQLPKFNLDNPAAKKYMLDTARMWLRDYRIDGFRLDHVPGQPNSFWNDFMLTIKSESPDAIAFGEVAIDTLEERFLPYISMDKVQNYFKSGRAVPRAVLVDAVFEYQDILDGCINFAFASWAGKYASGEISLGQFKQNSLDYLGRFNKKFKLISLLDNHDMDRILFLARGDTARLKEIVKFQFSLNQPKLIYYGTEVGMSQEKPININSGNPTQDLAARQPMIWDESLQNKDLLRFYKQVIKNAKR